MRLKDTALTALIALAAGFAGAGLWSVSGLGDGQTRDYLLENPDILPEMAEAYQKQESQDKLAQASDGIARAFPGAVLGNPQGSVTLVGFSDYNCTFCRASQADVQQLIAANPDLKVVMREWPIFEGSEAAARMALAAAKQGRYAAFHNTMFDLGQANDASVNEAARRAGLDMERALTDAASDAVTAELARNSEQARSVGFGGTPSWIAGGQLLEGAVGAAALERALNSAGS